MTLLKRRDKDVGTNVPNLFEDFFGSDLFDRLGAMSGGSNLPSVNIRDQKDRYSIEVAAPGLNKDDFNVEIDEGALTISSSKEASDEQKEGDYTRREFNYTAFQRTFTLPDTVKEDDISAEYEDGVLYINIPKKEEEKREKKKIDIK